MSEQLVIVGMNNPASDDPRRALWTQPPGCSGNRLWQMAAAHTGISEEDWLAVTDRRNLCIGEWDRPSACEQAEFWFEELRGRTVVWLGLEVMCAFRGRGGWLPSVPTPLLAPLEWHPTEDWFLVPHPSGMNRWYNCDAQRAAVEWRLADILWEMGHERDRRPDGCSAGNREHPQAAGDGGATTEADGDGEATERSPERHQARNPHQGQFLLPLVASVRDSSGPHR